MINTTVLNKTYSGTLSPGCQCCADCHWSCFYFSHNCPRHCFFCKPHGDRIIKPYEKPTGKVFSSVDEYVNFVRDSHLTGVSFSGGDPLLTLDDLLLYTKTLRTEFPNLYIWAYTSGQTLTPETASKLNDAGLNELRFNIASREYNIDPIIAANAIKTLTIEIPAIPEDVDTLKKTIPNLIKANVKHINLHELTAHAFNRRAMSERKYTIVNDVIIGSEAAALGIIDFVEKNNLPISVNYCSKKYKYERLQYKNSCK